MFGKIVENLIFYNIYYRTNSLKPIGNDIFAINVQHLVFFTFGLDISIPRREYPTISRF